MSSKWATRWGVEHQPYVLNIFFVFPPIRNGEDEPLWRSISFQMGGFNHHRVVYSSALLQVVEKGLLSDLDPGTRMPKRAAPGHDGKEILSYWPKQSSQVYCNIWPFFAITVNSKWFASFFKVKLRFRKWRSLASWKGYLWVQTRSLCGILWLLNFGVISLLDRFTFKASPFFDAAIGWNFILVNSRGKPLQQVKATWDDFNGAEGTYKNEVVVVRI